MDETATIDCPWCGSPTEITLDCSAGSQTFVEDCMVCCAPIIDSATWFFRRMPALYQPLLCGN